MIELLAKIFVKNKDTMSEQQLRSAYGYICGAFGIFLNVMLFAGKFFAGIISGSVAVSADAFNNLSDAGSSAISLIGFKLAAKKPDPGHPFGHGRYEYIASLLISALIIVMGFELGKSSVEKIINPSKAEYSVLVYVILAVSILVKFYMFYYNKNIGKKINSASMNATAMDSISDAVSTAAVLLSAFIAGFTDIPIDGFAGLAVTIFILSTGISSIKDTISVLLGEPPEREFVEEIEDIVMSHDNIIGIHDMIVHDYGPGRVFVTLHAEVPADGDIVEIHDTIDNIEREIYEKMNCLATIHMDPIDISGGLTSEIRSCVSDILNDIDPCINFHDFRIVSGPTHTNLIFDVVVPNGYRMSDNELSMLIAKRINEWNEKYFSVITVDKDFVGYNGKDACSK